MATVGRVQVGQPAPAFSKVAVVDGRLKDVSLSSYIDAKHWLILVFFPKAFSFICPTEIRAFNARLDEFLYSRSCAVVFASTDNEFALKAWNAQSEIEGGLGGVHVPLISDSNHSLSRDYGVLLEDQGIAQRALFIVDPKGNIRSITVNDADVGRSVDEAQRVLDALAFKDEFGEGCPVDWKKGDKGIDVKTPSTIEGAVEVRRLTSTFSDWARPKLQRAWSGASGLSGSSIANAAPMPRSTQQHDRNLSHSNLSSVDHSPMVSPGMRTSQTGFESQIDEALLQRRLEQHRIENLNAALQNQGIGMAT